MTDTFRLNAKDIEVYKFLCGWRRAGSVCPTLRDVMRGTAIISTGHLRRILDKLREVGMVTWEDGRYRTLQAVPHKLPWQGTVPGSGVPFAECVSGVWWEPGCVAFEYA